MSSKLYHIFEEVELKAKLLTNYWHNFYTEISQHLPETYQPEIQELSTNLEVALENLIVELRNPTLTLATTGTTSSGKSTLVNLLCGAEIVPVAVSEMSAGAVTIEYSNEKSLVIHETPGAMWECGEWRGIREEEIYRRLYEVMISYIDNREKQPNLACPQSVITYPFRLLKESKLELPRGTKVRILDLPGLAYVGDEGNASVIRQCREALCLVTYNSAETDKQRVRNLLQEVVEQVKDLGGSPARMLFVLNRIDVFRADRSWPVSEDRFVNDAIQNIKRELTEHLREYKEEIENLQVVKLSTWPALLALQIQNADDVYSADACKKADNNFNGLIEEILEDLPRNVQRWSRHDRSRVAEALLQKSYAEEFQQHLINHITQHFPQLVIPQAIERFNIAAGNAVSEWAIQTTTAILNSSKERYKAECERVEHIRASLKIFFEESDANLRKPFDEIAGDYTSKKEKPDADFILNKIDKNLSKLKRKKPYDELGDKLLPLYGWEQELNKYRNQVLEGVINSLVNSKIDLEHPSFRKANKRHIALLENNLKRLISMGYTASTAKNGEAKQAITDEEKTRLRHLNEELTELSINLNLVMEDVLKQVSEQEIDRMYQAVEELFKCHLSHLEQGAHNIEPNLAMRFPRSQLIRVQTQLILNNLNFESGFEITEKTWKEESRSFFHWFGLIPKIKVYSSDNATLPSAIKLLENWTEQAKQIEPEIAKQFIDWLLEQIDHLKKNIDQIQSDVINRYRARLDQANEKIALDYEKQVNIWHPIQQKAQALVKEFHDLEKILKEKDEL